MTLTIDDLLRAKQQLERDRVGTPLVWGARVHPADFDAMRRRDVPGSRMSPEMAGFAGVPVLADPAVPQGQYRVATSREQWQEWQTPSGGG